MVNQIIDTGKKEKARKNMSGDIILIFEFLCFELLYIIVLL